MTCEQKIHLAVRALVATCKSKPCTITRSLQLFTVQVCTYIQKPVSGPVLLCLWHWALSLHCFCMSACRCVFVCACLCLSSARAADGPSPAQPAASTHANQWHRSEPEPEPEPEPGARYRTGSSRGVRGCPPPHAQRWRSTGDCGGGSHSVERGGRGVVSRPVTNWRK